MDTRIEQKQNKEHEPTAEQMRGNTLSIKKTDRPSEIKRGEQDIDRVGNTSL